MNGHTNVRDLEQIIKMVWTIYSIVVKLAGKIDGYAIMQKCNSEVCGDAYRLPGYVMAWARTGKGTRQTLDMGAGRRP